MKFHKKKLCISGPSTSKVIAHLDGLAALKLQRFVDSSRDLHRFNKTLHDTSQVIVLAVGYPSKEMKSPQILNELCSVVVTFLAKDDEPHSYLALILTKCNGWRIIAEENTNSFTSYEAAALHLFRNNFKLTEFNR